MRSYDKFENWFILSRDLSTGEVGSCLVANTDDGEVSCGPV